MYLYRLARQFPDMVPAAVQSIDYAIRVDPQSALLFAAKFDLQAQAGNREAATATLRTLKKLVPRSPGIKEIVEGRGYGSFP